MNQDERKNEVEAFIKGVLDVLYGKGKAYSGNQDVHTSIRETAKAAGISPNQVILVFLEKHLSAIKRAIQENPENPVEHTESLDGRITDSINYLLMMHTLNKRVQGLPDD